MADPFEFAEGMVNQMLALATGTIGGIIAFFDDDKAAGVQLHGSAWLVAAIGLLSLSMFAGIVTLGSLTGQLTRKTGRPDANALGVRAPAMVQVAAFACGVLAVAAEVVFH